MHRLPVLRVSQRPVYTLLGTKHDDGWRGVEGKEDGVAKRAGSGSAEVRAAVSRGSLEKSTTGDGNKNNTSG